MFSTREELIQTYGVNFVEKYPSLNEFEFEGQVVVALHEDTPTCRYSIDAESANSASLSYAVSRPGLNCEAEDAEAHVFQFVGMPEPEELETFTFERRELAHECESR